MNELPDLVVEGDETIVTMKVHRLAHASNGLIAYASLAGPANAVKVIRGGLSQGLRPYLKGTGRLQTAKPSKPGHKPYRMNYTGLGDGYVHLELRYEPEYAVVLVEGTDEDWLAELMRVSTAPILPEYVPWLRETIKERHKDSELTTFNCDNAGAYQADDASVSKLLVEGVKTGELDLPECETDMRKLKKLSAYIATYAQKMVDSAGSSLHPLFDPRLEAPNIPAVKRQPFVPQAWLVEAVRRSVA